MSVTVLCVQTTLSTRCSAPSPAMAYRSQSLDCHNSPIVLGVCSEMFYLWRTAQRNEVTTGGRSRFHFSIYRMVSQNGFRFPMAQPGGMKSMSIHPPTQPIQNYTLPPPFSLKSKIISKLNPPGEKIIKQKKSPAIAEDLIFQMQIYYLF